MRTGIRNIKGGKSKQDDTGKDCLLYFYWQGKDCTVADKGTAALMMSDIDSDEGPQVSHDTQTVSHDHFKFMFGFLFSWVFYLVRGEGYITCLGYEYAPPLWMGS